MRIMGLDFGSKTVGVAVCDSLGITAQAVETITRRDENKLRQTLARREALIQEYGVEKIVLGYPKNMNNTLGERAEKSEEFKASLERRTGLPVGIHHTFFSTDNRNTLFICNHGYGCHTGCNDIVCRCVDYIHLACHGFHY